MNSQGEVTRIVLVLVALPVVQELIHGLQVLLSNKTLLRLKCERL